MTKKFKNKTTQTKSFPLRWSTVPILRMLLAFVAGILFEIFTESSYLIFLITGLVVLATLYIVLHLKKLNASRTLRWVYGGIITVCFFCCGVLITYVNNQRNYPNHFSKYMRPGSVYVVRITEPPVEKAKSVKLVTEVKGILNSGNYKSCSGQLLTYLEKDSTSLHLKYGQVLLLSGNPQSIKGPANPGEFNYKQFLYFHQIFQQIYLSKHKWILTSEYDGYTIFSLSYGLRDELVSILKKYLPSKREYAVASALTVGYEDDLDQELIQAYASSGALHVLSVSGMHVGLIYILLAWLFGFLDKIKRGRHLKFSILLLFLWFYALLTGMSPSVMRSAAMLSFVIIGMWAKRQNQVYNTLAVSFMILLCYNPFYITEVGFQLSYLAVFGIVFIHPLIFRWFEPSTKVMSDIWSITSVSLAAQTATFPLGLLYFHQFPLFFIISNLIVIPLSSIVIFSGILLMLISMLDSLAVFGFIAFYLGKIIQGVIWLINKVVLIVDQFSFTVINGISITIFETWIIYLLLFTSIAFLLSKSSLYLRLFMCCIIILLATQLMETIKIKNQHQLIVYSVKNRTAINFIDGTVSHFIADQTLVNDKSAMLFHVLHHWWDCGINLNNNVNLPAINIADEYSPNYYRHNNIIQFCDKKILIIDSLIDPSLFSGKHKIVFDYAIVNANGVEQFKKVTEQCQVQNVIIDSSNNGKTVKKIKQACFSNHITFYDVNQQEAFSLSL